MMETMFKEPPQIYKGTDLWMLNEELNEDEIRRQIAEFHDKGVGEFIVRTFLLERYDINGPEYKRAIRLILEEAEKYGMRVTLQAKSMPINFEDSPIEDVLDVIECVTKEYYESENCTQKKYFCTILEELGGYYIIKYKSALKPHADGRWRGGSLNMFNSKLCEKYIKCCYEDHWSEFREYFGKCVHTMWVDEPQVPTKSIPYPCDVERIFFQKWGYKIEDHLEELFFRVGDYHRVRYQYRVLLQKLLEEGYFQTLNEWCEQNNISFSGHLFNEDCLAAQIHGSIATMPYYKYLQLPGIDILEADMPWRYGAIKPPYSREYIGYDLEGEELPPLGRYAAPMATIGRYTTPLQVTSAAHQAGREHILCEMFGITPSNFTFRDQRRYFDHFAAMGINHKCIHAFFYSLNGLRKRRWAHHINYFQPYWERYSDMYNYFSRTSWFISQGKPVKDVVVIHPLDTAYMLYNPALDGEYDKNKELADYERYYYGIVRGLCAMQCQFEFGDEATIADWGKVTNCGFKIGQMTYKTVVLPYLHVLRESTVELLCEYAKKGGDVYILGTMPTRLDGEVCEELENRLLSAGCKFVAHRKGLLDILEEKNTSYTVSCTSDVTPIIVNHRADEDRDYYFIVNEECADDKEITLTVKGKKKATRWDALTAETETVVTVTEGEQTRICFTLPEGGSIMLTLEDGTASDTPVDEEKGYYIRKIPDQWNIRRHNPNVLLLENCQYKRNPKEEYSEKTYSALSIGSAFNNEAYEGEVYLRFTFDSKQIMPLQLALEELQSTEVWFNGEKADLTKKGYYIARGFEVIDLPKPCVIGMNEIILKKSFQPLVKAGKREWNYEHTSLESIYVLGDFGVFSREEPADNGTHRFSRFFALDAEKTVAGKDITALGYPFYAGAVSFTKNINISEEELKNEKVLFSYEEFHGCTAEIVVNGQSMGFIYWAPYELDIKKALKQGDNEITVKIAGSLRNLLGPYHRVQGELGHVWPNYIGINKASDNPGIWEGSPYNDNWMENQEAEDHRWTPDYFSLPFGFGKVSLKM